MEKKGIEEHFNKQDTLMVKGIGILLVYIHHLFSDEAVLAEKGVVFFLLKAESVIRLVAFSKVCVAVFLFLTAYGMTCKYRQTAQTHEELAKITLRKYVTLLLSFQFVFLFTHIFYAVFGKGVNLRFYGTSLSSIFFFLLDASGLSYFFGAPMLNATWWYMAVAFACLLLLPVLWKLERILGVMILPAVVLIPALFGFVNAPGTAYAFTLALGICAADMHLIERAGRIHFRIPILEKTGKLLACGILLVGLYKLRMSIGYEMLTDGIFAFVISYLVYEFIGKIYIVRNILGFLGKHAMNMFLMHSLIMLYLFQDITYSFRWGILILLFLVVVTVLISYLIEGLKKLCRFEKFISFIQKKILPEEV